MRKSKIFIVVTLAEVLLLTSCFLFAFTQQTTGRQLELQARQELVQSLGLTDFAIWTEARYTRHPSQTDFFSPFQEFPSAFEHFPAGSVVAPVFTAGGRTR